MAYFRNCAYSIASCKLYYKTIKNNWHKGHTERHREQGSRRTGREMGARRTNGSGLREKHKQAYQQAASGAGQTWGGGGTGSILDRRK